MNISDEVSGIYYRVIAATGDVVTLQEFDERDYDKSIWLTDLHGRPLAFSTEEEAKMNYVAQVRHASETMRRIGESFMDARELLEAAAPHLMAAAWDEGRAAGFRDAYADEEEEELNPYRSAGAGE